MSEPVIFTWLGGRDDFEEWAIPLLLPAGLPPPGVGWGWGCSLPQVERQCRSTKRLPDFRTLTEQWGKLRDSFLRSHRAGQSPDTLHPVFYPSAHHSKNNTEEKNNRSICWIHPRCWVSGQRLSTRCFYSSSFYRGHIIIIIRGSLSLLKKLKVTL